MTSIPDKDTWNQFYRLLLIGVIIIGLFSVFDSAPFVLRALGNIFVLGGLLFFIDVEGSEQFRNLYWCTLSLWSVVVIHSGLGFVSKSPEAVVVFQTITFAVYATSLLAVLLFVWMMYEFNKHLQSGQSDKWKWLAKVTATAYSVPFVAFVGTSIGRAFGAEVQLFYGAEEPGIVQDFIVKYGVRLSFFAPLVQILMTINRSRKEFAELRPNKALNLSEGAEEESKALPQKINQSNPPAVSTLVDVHSAAG